MHDKKQIKLEGQSVEDFNKLDTLWRYPDLARYLKMSTSTLRRDVMLKKIPHVKLGRAVRFQPEVIHEWIKSQFVSGA